MVSRLTKIVTGLIGVILVSTLVLGLSYSISTRFAGFLGGLPFAIIVVIVLGMVVYNFWDECVRKERD